MFSSVPYAQPLVGPSSLNFQARQFEYHPELNIMGVGTCQGEVLVLDWEENKLWSKATFAGDPK
jgi:hypothetical protein